MKIFIAGSKRFYNRIPEIEAKLIELGHECAMPNCFDEPMKEEEMRALGEKEHAEWKSEMLKKDKENLEPNEAILVLNFEKDGQENFVGGATFLEMYKAWEMGKKIFIYNPIPDNMLHDEILGFGTIVLNGNLERIV